MTVNLSQGIYTLVTGCEDIIRNNYASIKTTIDAEMVGETVALPEMQTNGSNIYIGDGRLPPQSEAWVTFAASILDENVTLSTQSRTRFRLDVTSGIRRTSLATSDNAPHPESAGWRVASVFSQAIVHVLTKHITSSVSGAYNSAFISSRRRSPNQKMPNSYEYDLEMVVWMITYNAFNT